jgi:chromosomal replication initiator protein
VWCRVGFLRRRLKTIHLLSQWVKKTATPYRARNRAQEIEGNVNNHDMEIVRALRAAIVELVGQRRFELWFGSNTRLELVKGVLVVGAPNQFFLEWLRNNFRRHLEAACLAVLGKVAPMEFRVDAAGDESQARILAAPAGATRPTMTTTDEGNGRHAAAGKQLMLADSPGPTSTAAASSEVSSSTAFRKLPETAEAPAGTDGRQGGTLPPRRFAHLASFVPGEVNRLALATAETAARCPGQMTPILFHGPTGVGKTHLVEGIWIEARKSLSKLHGLFLTAEQFTTYFLEALHGGGLPSFRRKYRKVGLLIIDDLQFFIGKRTTLSELLHTADTLLREGRQLVFTADRPPRELGGLGAELIARLQSGMVCPVEPPDYSARLGIIDQFARNMGLVVPPPVKEFVAARLTNHARELSGALCRLQATSAALGKPITLPLAEEALADLIRQSGRVVRLPDIERAVCAVFGVEPESLHSEQKSQRVSHPRMLAMWLARKYTRAALSEIGHYFGGRSHSTVVSAQKRVDRWMANRQPLRLADRTWPVEEAVREVERHLAAS